MNIGKQIFAPIGNNIESQLQELKGILNRAGSNWDDISYETTSNYVKREVIGKGDSYIDSLRQLSYLIDQDIDRIEQAMCQLSDMD